MGPHLHPSLKTRKKASKKFVGRPPAYRMLKQNKHESGGFFATRARGEDKWVLTGERESNRRSRRNSFTRMNPGEMSSDGHYASRREHARSHDRRINLAEKGRTIPTRRLTNDECAAIPRVISSPSSAGDSRVTHGECARTNERGRSRGTRRAAKNRRKKRKMAPRQG